LLKKFFGGGRVWGVGCGVWGFTSFEVANYLIFREKVPKLFWLFWFLCGNEVYTDRISAK
jgi:hypothetical protein